RFRRAIRFGGPSARQRDSGALRTVLRPTPKAVATACGAAPQSASGTPDRPWGGRRAFLWMSIRSPLGTEALQPQFPRSGPDGQPIEGAHLRRAQIPNRGGNQNRSFAVSMMTG